MSTPIDIPIQPSLQDAVAVTKSQVDELYNELSGLLNGQALTLSNVISIVHSLMTLASNKYVSMSEADKKALLLKALDQYISGKVVLPDAEKQLMINLINTVVGSGIDVVAKIVTQVSTTVDKVESKCMSCCFSSSVSK